MTKKKKKKRTFTWNIKDNYNLTLKQWSHGIPSLHCSSIVRVALWYWCPLIWPFSTQHRELSGGLGIWESRLEILEACHSACSRHQLSQVPSALERRDPVTPCHLLPGRPTHAQGQGQWFPTILSTRTPFHINIFYGCLPTSLHWH